MKKNQVYTVIAVLIVAAAGLLGYKYLFNKKKTARTEQASSAESLTANSCWIYHEYVYRVNFSDRALQPFLFIRNTDGTFSPSIADSSGNTITGNGLIIDEEGGCVSTEQIGTPWKLSEEEQEPLRELVDTWLDTKYDLYTRDYTITGQTVALFIVLSNPEDFIEYNVTTSQTTEQGYSILYPAQRTGFDGIETGVSFLAAGAAPDTSFSEFQVLNATLDENNTENPAIKTEVKNIMAALTMEGYLDKVQSANDNTFFNEGAMLFDKSGTCLGNLHYENSKWRLMPIMSIAENHRVYEDYDPKESWEYDKDRQSWIKTK